MTGIALVTGGQQGIGLGICRALATAGFRIAISSEARADAPAVQNALADLGDVSRYFRHDLQQLDSIETLLDEIDGSMGPVSTLISNAGVPARVRGDLLDLTPENYDFAMGVNLRGAFFLAQAVARRMQNRPSHEYRSMIFITSASAEMVSVERAEYCISKAGAAMMARLFAVRLAPLGIGVFDVRPGIIETDMTAGVKEKYTARIEEGLVPAGRWGLPDDVGRIIVPIVRGDMAFSTGTVIAVDGGLSIPRL